jgi:hypothetical protein
MVTTNRLYDSYSNTIIIARILSPLKDISNEIEMSFVYILKSTKPFRDM